MRSLGLFMLLLFTTLGTAYAQLQLQVTNQNNNLCYGDAGAKFTVTASGGTAPYLFSFDGGVNYLSGDNNKPESKTYEKLPAGTYRVMVVDANRDRAIVSVSITQGDPFYASATATNVTRCGAYNGQVTINATGGKPPYQYREHNGWSSWVNSNVFPNLSIGEYRYDVRDANGCITTVVSYVAPPVYLNARIGAVVNPDNCTTSNGSITLIPPTTGSGNYQYRIASQWGGWQNDPDFNNLNTGSYRFEVRDLNNNCVQDVRFYLSYNNPLSGRAVVTNAPPCPMDATGTVELTASGGTPPYQFSFNNSGYSNTTVYGNLTKGPYTYRISDANGCSFWGIVNLWNSGNDLRLNLTATDARCFQNDGTITANASGGTPPYQYQIDERGGLVNSNVFNNLRTGQYDVKVQDSKGCVAWAWIQVKNPLRMSVDTLQMPTCYGREGDGSIRVNATGSPGPYEYSIDRGANWQDNNLFENLGMESYYTIMVRDVSNGNDKGCTAEFPFRFDSLIGGINSEILLLSSCDTIQPKCDGTPGKIIIHARPSRVKFEYSLSPYQRQGEFPTPTAKDWQTDSVFNNLEAGVTYYPHVRIRRCLQNDQNNFPIPIQKYADGTLINRVDTIMDSMRFVTGIRFNPKMRATFDISHLTTCGATDGRITVHARGTAPFQFSVNSGAFQADSVLSGLSAGMQTIQVKDGTGCIQTFVREIHTPTPFGFSVSATGVSRSGATDGKLFFDLTNGVAFPVTVRINNGLLLDNNNQERQLTQLSENLEQQPEGWYYVEVKDANGCIARDTAFIGIDRQGFDNDVSGFVFEDVNNNGTRDPGENAIPDVMIYVLSPTGDRPVLYGSTDQFGFYSLSLKEGEWNIYARGPAYSTRSYPAQDYHTIRFTRPNQDQSGRDFGFHRDPNAQDVTVTVTNVGGLIRSGKARYMITRWNRGNKVMDGTVKFKNDPLVILNPTQDFLPVNDGFNNGEYLWNYNNFRKGIFENITIYGNLDPAGTNGTPVGCSASIDPTTGDMFLPNNNNTDTTIITAPLDPNIKIVQRENGSKADTVFQDETLIYTIFFQNLGNAPAHTVRIVDEFDEHFDMTTFETIASSFATPQVSYRGGVEDLTTFSPTSSTSKVTVMWTMTGIDLPAKSVDEAGSIGFVKFRIKLRQDPKMECEYQLKNSMKIYFDYEEPVEPKQPALTLVNPKPTGEFTATPETLSVGEPVLVEPKTLKYYDGGEWSAPDARGTIPTITNSQTAKPFTVSYDTPGEKTITLKLKNDYCESDPIEKRVYVVKGDVMPNTFSPNNDGINDFWEIRSPELERLQVSIFDRWGTKVYDTDGTEAKWDGKNCPTGNYFFQMEKTFRNGKKQQVSGSITLLR